MVGGSLKDEQTCFDQRVVHKLQEAKAIIDMSLQNIKTKKTLSDTNGHVVKVIWDKGCNGLPTRVGIPSFKHSLQWYHFQLGYHTIRQHQDHPYSSQSRGFTTEL